MLARVDSGQISAPEAIRAVLDAQISLRNNRRLEAAMRSSRLPAVKALADFGFSFQPSVKREQIDSLATLGFLERKENVIFLGPPGVGKTHLAIGLAIAAAQSGLRLFQARDQLTECAVVDPASAHYDRADLYSVTVATVYRALLAEQIPGDDLVWLLSESLVVGRDPRHSTRSRSARKQGNRILASGHR